MHCGWNLVRNHFRIIRLDEQQKRGQLYTYLNIFSWYQAKSQNKSRNELLTCEGRRNICLVKFGAASAPHFITKIHFENGPARDERKICPPLEDSLHKKLLSIQSKRWQNETSHESVGCSYMYSLSPPFRRVLWILKRRHRRLVATALETELNFARARYCKNDGEREKRCTREK